MDIKNSMPHNYTTPNHKVNIKQIIITGINLETVVSILPFFDHISAKSKPTKPHKSVQ